MAVGMAVGVGDRVVAERIFHGREKHEETFRSDFKSPWNPWGGLLPSNLLNL